MGAEQFFVTSTGKNPFEAFDRAVAQAQYDFGHAGYTGTIAEKSDFSMMRVPVDSWRWDKIPGFLAREAYKRDRESPKVRLPGNPLPDKYKAEIRRLAEIYDNKWGPAIGYEVTGTAAVEIKEAHGRKLSHDKAYVFCGWASA
jgi:hypothetical protein